MTRRIAWTLTILTSVLLVLAVVPLAVSMTARERVAYRDSQRAATRVIAAAAEEHLSDHKPATVMRQELAAAARAGDCAAVYDASARLVASTPCTAAQGEEAEELVERVLGGHEPEPPENEGRLLAAEPAGEVRQPSGAVVLARSAAPLAARVTAIWGWSAAIGAAGLAASVLLSVRLAHWVGRPLSTLDAAARRLGEGALGERADVAGGPPEVRRLAATFNTMAARTEALVHGHRAVIADVSHQLRTPLAALRLRLGVRRWKAVHWLAYAAWPLALFHGVGTGTDTRLPLQLWLYAGCLASVVGAVWWRLAKAGPGRVTGRLVAAVAATAAPVVLSAFLATGPLQPGWAQRAATTAVLLGGGR
ncbi:hypothetical protein C1I97_02925 [Streptomyces sp. NTH33]|uniref:HAMP domain-containing protein n=1 Tax=Streptomyces sp. NTH33 TaxID=1735453 RepID=UPI000DA72491|nr:HAMP domain-containing protein [Streptomyces sp. NTH33]PZH19103.1 hypothetical protein C1I97_02925 [Streptomyces sp. NTH33]